MWVAPATCVRLGRWEAQCDIAGTWLALDFGVHVVGVVWLEPCRSRVWRRCRGQQGRRPAVDTRTAVSARCRPLWSVCVVPVHIRDAMCVHNLQQPHMLPFWG